MTHAKKLLATKATKVHEGGANVHGSLWMTTNTFLNDNDLVLVGKQEKEVRNFMSDSREFLRHTLATVAYRGAKSIRGAGPDFAEYGSAETSRTPVKVLAHVGDLMEWGLSMADGSRKWNDSAPLAWEEESRRFFATLKKFDDYLASEKPLQVSAEKLFQGPIADALTHVGQIAMLRRMAGVAIKGENYFVAEVTVGRVGADQEAPRKEF
jgi:hypothetical protein